LRGTQNLKDWREDDMEHQSNRESISDKKQDARKKSLSEAFANSFGSSPIGYCIGIIILPISAGWIKENPFVATIMVTMVYATVSFVRVYFLRRLFAKIGFEDNFVGFFIKLCKQITTRKGGGI